MNVLVYASLRQLLHPYPFRDANSFCLLGIFCHFPKCHKGCQYSLADALGVSPLALSVPDIDSYLGLMHTLFTLEDRYGLTIEKGENGVSMSVDPRKGKDAAELSEMLNAWAEQAEKYHNGDISREDYDKWRYNYPKYDENSGYVKVPSQEFSDVMTEAFKNRLKEI